MVGCLQAIRHSTSLLARRKDWISNRGDIVRGDAGGGWGGVVVSGQGEGIEQFFNNMIRAAMIVPGAL